LWIYSQSSFLRRLKKNKLGELIYGEKYRSGMRTVAVLFATLFFRTVCCATLKDINVMRWYVFKSMHEIFCSFVRTFGNTGLASNQRKCKFSMSLHRQNFFNALFCKRFVLGKTVMLQRFIIQRWTAVIALLNSIMVYWFCWPRFCYLLRDWKSKNPEGFNGG